MSYNNITPCVGYEEVCGQIKGNLRVYMGMMDWNCTKADVWAFWRTLCSFIVRRNDIAILGEMYDDYMSDFNKEKVTKAQFITYMTRSTV